MDDDLVPGERIACPKCGTRFPVPEQRVRAEDHAYQEEEERPLPLSARQKRPKRKSYVGLIVGLASAAVVLLAIAGVGAAIVFLRLREEATPPVNEIQAAAVQAAPVKIAEPEIKVDLNGWLQDLQEAKALAAKENKDVFILFNDTDWPAQWKKTAEVLSLAEFAKEIPAKFVRVFIDSAESKQKLANIQNPERNAELHKQFGVSDSPTIVLADAQGRPYAVKAGFKEDDSKTYYASLQKLREQRAQRDQLLDKYDKAQGAAKLLANRDLLKYLQEQKLQQHYPAVSEEGEKLARHHDAKNEQGILEVYFELKWSKIVNATRFQPNAKNDKLQDFVKEMNAWRKDKQFKDANRAAEMLLNAATLLQIDGKRNAAFEYLDEAIAYQPTQKELRQRLSMALATLGIGGGTGFVIAPGGYILTNYHVIRDNRQIRVRMPQIKKSVLAKVVAEDEKVDIALIQLKNAGAIDLKPLLVAGQRAVNRADPVAALGFPLGDMVGSGLKFTTGVVSATPEAGNDNKLLLDAKVNPGNSGGPLLDWHGNVIGMVTAKSFAFGNIESYGLAIPAPDLEVFLKKNLKDYKSQKAEDNISGWEQVNRLASPSVFMVLKAPKKPPQFPGIPLQGMEEPENP
jgi:S1-C subfamily serine protease/thioredoxin-related protein